MDFKSSKSRSWLFSDFQNLRIISDEITSDDCNVVCRPPVGCGLDGSARTAALSRDWFQQAFSFVVTGLDWLKLRFQVAFFFGEAT